MGFASIANHFICSTSPRLLRAPSFPCSKLEVSSFLFIFHLKLNCIFIYFNLISVVRFPPVSLRPKFSLLIFPPFLYLSFKTQSYFHLFLLISVVRFPPVSLRPKFCLILLKLDFLLVISCFYLKLNIFFYLTCVSVVRHFEVSSYLKFIYLSFKTHLYS